MVYLCAPKIKVVQTEIDENIIKGCVENKREAQSALYKQYYAQFMRISLRYTKSKDEAAEILNTSFLKIFNKINTYNAEGNFVGWMQRIVVNTALDHLKSENKYYQQQNLEAASSHFSEDESDSLEAEDLLNMIRKLPMMQQQVFNLFAIDGYSHLETAKMLDITEATSKWHLFNARKALQEMVNKLNYAY